MPARRPTRPHYIQPNETSRLPRRFVFLDTEAHREHATGIERQTFRVGVTAWHDTDRRTGDPTPAEWAAWTDPADLWRWVSARTRDRGRVVVVAHNLAYDLRLAGAFVHLPALGYACERVRLDRNASYAVWRRGRSTLVMVDLYSWLPARLDVVARWLQLPKPPLPSARAGDAEWLQRCIADVDVVRAAWGRIIGWLREQDLGTWQPTGAGQAWAAWRHRYMTHRVLAGLDETTRAAERESAWTGRCEAWRHGHQARGPYTEWDYHLAYARVCATTGVPVRPVGAARPASLDRVLRSSRSLAWLCRVHVDTDVPILPTRVDDHVAWPVGRFSTTIWEHELALALEEGASVEIEWARPYMRKPALQQFAGWAIPIVEAGERDGDPLIAAVVKHWTRALVGRFGLRYKTWERWATAHEPGCVLLPGQNLSDGSRYRLLWVGRDVMRETDLLDADDCVPAILAYIMGECRVRLWRAMRTAGLDQVVYIDTDSLIVSSAGHARLRRAVEDGQHPGLRQKASFASVEIMGPRQLIAGGEVRVSGLPKNARQVSPGVYEGRVWRTLGASLQMREPDAVTITDRTVTLRSTDRRRLRRARGRTEPIRVEEA